MKYDEIGLFSHNFEMEHDGTVTTRVPEKRVDVLSWNYKVLCPEPPRVSQSIHICVHDVFHLHLYSPNCHA